MNLRKIATRRLGRKYPELPKGAMENIVDDIFGLIVEYAGRGEKVTIGGFGKFIVKEQRQRKAWNPARMECFILPPTKKLKFIPTRKKRSE